MTRCAASFAAARPCSTRIAASSTSGGAKTRQASITFFTHNEKRRRSPPPFPVHRFDGAAYLVTFSVPFMMALWPGKEQKNV